MFQELTVLQELNLTPGEWADLPRIDKKILYYYCIMQGYRREKEMDHTRKLREVEEQQQQFLRNLPEQTMTKGRKAKSRI